MAAFCQKTLRGMDSGTLREQSTVGWLEHGGRVVLGAGVRWLEMERVGLGCNAHRAGRFYSASIRELPALSDTISSMKDWLGWGTAEVRTLMRRMEAGDELMDFSELE